MKNSKMEDALGFLNVFVAKMFPERWFRWFNIAAIGHGPREIDTMNNDWLAFFQLSFH